MSDGRDAKPSASAPVSGAARPTAVARHELVILALLMLIALGLRLWRLDLVPGGPHVDEAWNWIDARRVLEGWRPVFLPDNAGREVLYTYLQAGLLATFGDGIGILRAASALAATALVPLAWAVSRAFAPRDLSKAWIGLPCAALAAGGYWSLHFGRFGIRAITFPLFVGGVALLWLRAVRAADERVEANPRARGIAAALRRHRWALLCGLVLGLAVYSHPAGRGLVALPAVHAAWLAWRAWRTPRATSTAPWRTLGIAVATGLLVASPVIAWWTAHPNFFLGHAGEVSILDGGPGALLANGGKVLGMFHFAGDPARWRNLPGRPVFDPLTGLLFLAGLGLALRAAWRGERGPALALGWLFVLLAPTVLADQAPNFSRAIGILPVVWVFPAWALAWLAGRVVGRAGAHSRLATLAALALVAVVPLRAADAAVRDYFLDWATHPETPLAFDDDLAALGRLAGDRWQRGGTAYLSPELAAHPTVRIASPVFVPGVDLNRGIALRERLDDGIALGMHLSSARIDPSRGFLDALDHGTWRHGLADALTVAHSSPQPHLQGAHVRLDLSETTPPDERARFGPLELVHAFARTDGISGGEGVLVGLGWRVTGVPEASLTLTVRLVDATGRTIAQRDGLPLGPAHTTDHWRAGEIVLIGERFELASADGPWSGPADVLVGWYELGPGPEDAEDGAPRITDLTTADGRALIRAAQVDSPWDASP